MNKLVEALEECKEAYEIHLRNGDMHKQYLVGYSHAMECFEKALAEYSASPTAPAQKTFTDEEGREWQLLDFGYGTASDLRLQLRLGAGLFDSQVIEVSRAPTAPPTDAEIMAVQKSVNTVLNYTPERVVKLAIEAFQKMRE